MKMKIARMAGWVVTAGLLVLLFRKTPFSEVINALREARPWIVPTIALFTFFVWVADTFAVARTFTYFATPLSFREVFLIRGATYLMAVINYSIGQGAIVYFVKKSHGVPLRRGAAVILLIMGINLLMLVILTTVGMLTGAESPPGLRPVILASHVGLIIYVIAMATKPAWLVKRPLFDVLLSAGFVGHLKALMVRAPHVFCIFTMSYLGMRAFNVDVPVSQAVLCLPVVFFISVLPISFQGLGTSQAAMVFFFARYAHGDAAHRTAAILASSLTGQTVVFIIQLMIGLVCIRTQAGRTVKEAEIEPTASAAS